MSKIIKIKELICTEIRSRSNANVIWDELSQKDSVIIDMSFVTFVSRSFADELCNIMDTNGNISLANASGIVKNMIEIVCKSRKEKRVRKEDHSEMKEFGAIESLSDFLATI